MFGTLRDKFSHVQEGLSASFRGLSVANRSTKYRPGTGAITVDFNPNCGAELLKHYQDCWTAIHEETESNAKKARDIDRRLCDLHHWLDGQWQTISQLNSHLAGLPDLVQRVDVALESIGVLQGLFEEVEDALTHLEDIQETQALRERQLDHRFQFALYKEKRLGNLKDLKSELARDHAEKLKDHQERTESSLKERQAVFKQAFDEELEQYKRTGKLPDSGRHCTPVARIKLEDVSVEEDTSELDSFLSDEGDAKDETKNDLEATEATNE